MPFQSLWSTSGRTITGETLSTSTGALHDREYAFSCQKKLTLDDNQQVFIENQPILGAGAGEGALGVCRPSCILETKIIKEGEDA